MFLLNKVQGHFALTLFVADIVLAETLTATIRRQTTPRRLHFHQTPERLATRQSKFALRRLWRVHPM